MAIDGSPGQREMPLAAARADARRDSGRTDHQSGDGRGRPNSGRFQGFLSQKFLSAGFDPATHGVTIVAAAPN
jgi:hypothetical protein